MAAYTRLGFGLLLAAILAAGGCAGSLKQPPAQRAYYLLEADPGPECAGRPTLPAVLEVHGLSVSPGFDSRQFVYRLADNSWTTDYYHLFLTDPGGMLTPVVGGFLAKSRLFATVAGPGLDLDSDYILEGSVTALYGDFREADKPQAVVEIQFFLLDDRGEDNALILEKTYRQAAPLPAKSPEGLARGFDEALRLCLCNLVLDMEAALVERR
jgi:ABC-type uncharacterized transport system auxiliary subunit